MPAAPATVMVLSGPSGVGKGTVLSALRELRAELHVSVSATTRPPRDGERDGVHYHFLTDEQFERLRDRGELLECAQYAGRWYGTPAAEIQQGRSTVIECDVDGAAQLRGALPDAALVFIAPPSLAELERRLRGRGTETPEQITRRLARAEHELAQASTYDHVLTADDVDTLARALDALLAPSLTAA